MASVVCRPSSTLGIVVLTYALDENGACSQEAGASKYGVKVGSKIEVDLSVGIDGNLGEAERGQPLIKRSLLVSGSVVGY